MPITVGLALMLSQALSVPTTPPAPKQAQTVEEYVKTYFADVPVMADIASCESHYRQYDSNGAIYRGTQNNQDVGVMQINEHYHLDTATKLGFDIYSIEGNVAYARYLYEKEGVTPWASSSPCWSKTKNAKQLLTRR